MSEHITHIAICDDVTRLATRHPDVHPFFNEVVAAFRDVARFGATTRSADRWSIQLITWAREQVVRALSEQDRQLRPKLAFVIGALTHRAADRLMKPILHYAETQEGHEGFVDATIHCDIFCFKELYGGGEGEQAGPFPKALLSEPATEAQLRMEEYFRVLWRRQLVAMHTFAPDSSDVHGWLDKLFYAMQDFPMELSRYAKVAAEWDPSKVNRYLERTHFYDRSDAIIRIARDIQHGRDVADDAVVAAMAATTDDSSRYARALAKGLSYLVAATLLFKEATPEEEAKVRLDVGVPELSLTFTP